MMRLRLTISTDFFICYQMLLIRSFLVLTILTGSSSCRRINEQDERLRELERSLQERNATDKSQAEAIEQLTMDYKALSSALARVEATLSCVDRKSDVKRAWATHLEMATKAAAGACNQIGSVCASTGLPPETIARYSKSLSRMLLGLDTSLEEFESTYQGLPKLVSPPVASDANVKMTKSRAAAEKATQEFAERCRRVTHPAEETIPSGASSASPASSGPKSSAAP